MKLGTGGGEGSERTSYSCKSEAEQPRGRALGTRGREGWSSASPVSIPGASFPSVSSSERPGGDGASKQMHMALPRSAGRGPVRESRGEGG